MSLPVVTVERIMDNELTELYGQYVHAKRTVVAKVFGVTGQGAGTVFFDVLGSANMPKTGDKISNELPRLCVYQRTPKIVGWSNDVAHVEVEIEYALEEPTLGYPLRGTASLSQIRTHKDKTGTDITVSYNGASYPLVVSAFAPEAVETRVTVELTNDPGQLRDQWIGKVNSDTWMNCAAGYWLVSRVEYDVVNFEVSPNRYRFIWEFHRTAEPGGWKVWGIYRDKSGQIPPDASWSEIQWFTQTAFSTKFPWTGTYSRNSA